MRIRKDARQRYSFSESLFSRSGHLVLKSIRSAHEFANEFNSDRPDLEKISPAELNAASIVHEIQHLAISDFVNRHDPDFFGRVLDDAQSSIGSDSVTRTLEAFTERFPTDDIIESQTPPSAYLDGQTDGTPNREVTLEEMLLCWVSNANPAYAPFTELIRDDDLRKGSPYNQVIDRFTAPASSTSHGTSAAIELIDLLQEPARHAPDSLQDQLAFMAGDSWDFSLPPNLVQKVAIGGDLIAEEHHALAARAFAPGPPPPPPVPEYLDEPEFEQFSPDVDWMPRVVMVAKNASVWLDQLSKRYGRPITSLDAIPDEELEQLARWGFTALWLIGIWERSEASRELKHRTGNPDAQASAYSLYDYVIAEELGGNDALDTFRESCHKHGLRLSADMVPNHTGIASKWVTEHPDWFVQLPYPPYPSYSYSSESLTDDPGLVIQIEDGYYDRSDAAVTFRRVDTSTGEERFIYHGNDGTGMAWNDTAQLDFTRADVREAVIQTILHVARQFPVIRFDAAMVLTRKNFRRLWYPAPGSGGGVPSRAEHGLSTQEFDDRMPVEFWREVVDRVAEEAPDTLLLAEAFWLLEGYFVRTLGMHRVYNSAFMHMLKDEDNKKYREVMKNTLAFEPEVLKRYVNFMSNPDEETAIDQFGDGDRFFGVSTLLITMPGLPMIAHGQVEGLTEKYGMEYRRAYHDEPVRDDLINRFEREIVPLIRKRYLFADVTNFFLFDFESENGSTNENVFAYSNGHAAERALVVFNNRYGNASGRVRLSTGLGDGAERANLSKALDLDRSSGDVVTFKDVTSRLEYVVSAEDFFDKGLELSLNAYEHHVFTGFEIVEDDEAGTLLDLAARLGGRGTASLESARDEIILEPLVRLLATTAGAVMDDEEDEPTELLSKVAELLSKVAELLEIEESEVRSAVEDFAESIRNVRGLHKMGSQYTWPKSSRYKNVVADLEKVVEESQAFSALVAIACLKALAGLDSALSDYKIRPVADRIMLKTGLATPATVVDIGAIAEPLFLLERGVDETNLSLLLDRSHFASAFLINEFEGTSYYNKERFELGLETAFCLDVLKTLEEVADGADVVRAIADHHDSMQSLRADHEKSAYKWDDLTTSSHTATPK